MHFSDSCQIALPEPPKGSACDLQSGIRLRGQWSCAARSACPRSIRPDAAPYLGIVTSTERCATAAGDTTFCRCCTCSFVLPSSAKLAECIHAYGPSQKAHAPARIVAVPAGSFSALPHPAIDRACALDLRIAQQQKPTLLPATVGIAHSNDNQQPSGARMLLNSNQELFAELELCDQPR